MVWVFNRFHLFVLFLGVFLIPSVWSFYRVFLGWPLTYLIFSVVLDELWWIEIMILTSLSASLFADYYAFPPVHLYSRLLALAAVKRLEGASFFVRPLVGGRLLESMRLSQRSFSDKATGF